jgi:AmmeMemoRadiSam system protein A
MFAAIPPYERGEEIMAEKSIFVKLAFEAIENHLKNKKTEWKEVPEVLKREAACFVSIHTEDGGLRGCIGTILPVHGNLFEEIKSNAVSAAFRDPRFLPMTLDEVKKAEISVDILSTPERVHSLSELDHIKYGVIVSDGRVRRGVLLPDLDGVDSVEEQVRIAKIKAGINEKTDDSLEIYRFTVERNH